MSIKEKAVKVKEYVKNNKREIAVSVYGGCMLAVGFVIADRTCFRRRGLNGRMNVITSDSINNFVDDIKSTYSKSSHAYLAYKVINTPLNVNDLGKLGEAFKDLGVENSCRFTHFLAVGENITK